MYSAVGTHYSTLEAAKAAASKYLTTSPNKTPIIIFYHHPGFRPVLWDRVFP